MSTINNIKKLEQKRTRIIDKLLKTKAMIRGSFGTTYRRCGVATCWCKNASGHPYTRITWTEKGKARTQPIPKERIKWTKEMTKNYKQFRVARQQLRELQEQLKDELNKLEEELIEKTNSDS